MHEIWQAISNWFTSERLTTVGQGLTIIVVGLLIARAASAAVTRALADRASPQYAMITRRLVSYGLGILAIISGLRHMGFDMSILVGAAGILTVAIGFASQTSASNLISGVFLMGEKPFVVGDVIQVGATTGEVTSIDLLSVKLRTFDNLLVRIPNESLLKSELTNMTHYPLRRADLELDIAYKEDIAAVRKLLVAVADRNPLCLESPAPVFQFLGFADSSISIQFSVWGMRENFLALRNSMYEEIKVAFDEAGVEIPFPQRSLVAGSATAPLPVRVLGPDEISD